MHLPSAGMIRFRFDGFTPRQAHLSPVGRTPRGGTERIAIRGGRKGRRDTRGQPPGDKSTASTRRFASRPASVLFGAIGAR